MKEASGELNMTIFIVITIGILSAFFFAVLWPSIKGTFISNSKCNNAVCDSNTLSDGMVTCKYYDDNGHQQGSDFKCVWKG